jgi:hypothetical protein
MLETIRTYALDTLSASGEEEQIRKRHAAYFLELGQRAEPELMGASQADWLDRLDREHDNLRAVLTYFLAQGDADSAAALGWGLHWFWYIRGHASEGREWIERILASETTLSPRGRAQAHGVRAMLAFTRGHYDEGAVAAAESARLAADTGDMSVLAFAKLSQANMALGNGNGAEAREFAKKGAGLYRELADWTGLGLTIAAEFHVAAVEGDLAKADAILEQAEAFLRKGGAPWSLAYLLVMRARIAQLAGSGAESVDWSREAISLSWQIGDIVMLRFGLTGLAGALAERGEGLRAARLSGAVEALGERTGAVMQNAADRSLAEHHREILTAQLDPDALAAAWSAGRNLSLPEAVLEALALPD